ncbi:MAG: FeoB-associated Cys-rich membrane protein [Eubacterium sp.]|nr:FeoB-associated Cys-rich membrane protein [Eubacterium sp.]
MAANIIILSIIAVLVFIAAKKVISDRKKGIGSCGHSCGNCPSHCNCHADRASVTEHVR